MIYPPSPAGANRSPVGLADEVTFTTHKTRNGAIIQELAGLKTMAEQVRELCGKFPLGI